MISSNYFEADIDTGSTYSIEPIQDGICYGVDNEGYSVGDYFEYVCQNLPQGAVFDNGFIVVADRDAAVELMRKMDAEYEYDCGNLSEPDSAGWSADYFRSIL